MYVVLKHDKPCVYEDRAVFFDLSLISVFIKKKEAKFEAEVCQDYITSSETIDIESLSKIELFSFLKLFLQGLKHVLQVTASSLVLSLAYSLIEKVVHVLL